VDDELVLDEAGHADGAKHAGVGEHRERNGALDAVGLEAARVDHLVEEESAIDDVGGARDRGLDDRLDAVETVPVGENGDGHARAEVDKLLPPLNEPVALGAGALEEERLQLLADAAGGLKLGDDALGLANSSAVRSGSTEAR
jgi:hypothetical protein